MSMRAGDFSPGQVPEITTQSYEGRAKAPTPLGLTLLERRELEWRWNDYEAEIGIRSTFSSMVTAMQGVGADEWGFGPRVPGGGGVPDSDVCWEPFVRSPVARARGIDRALRAMPGHHVTVLWLLHGPTRRGTVDDIWKDVAPIAHLTAAAEEAREQMAEREGERREERAEEGTAVAFDEHRDGLVETFWEAAGEYQRLEARLLELFGDTVLSAAKVARAQSMHTRLEAWWEVMGRALAAYRDAGARAPQARLSARLSALASADHELTTQGAIRWRLDYHGPRGKDGRPAPDANKAHQASRAAFIAAVRIDAERMRIAAANAYRAARKEIVP